MLILTTTQKSTLTLDPRDAKGNPAKLDGIPVWSTANPAVGALDVAPDGLSATFVAGEVGATQVSVVADADLDEGEVRELTGVLDVEVKAAEAISLGVGAGAPEEQ